MLVVLFPAQEVTMTSETVIVRKRETVLSLWFWIKLVLTLGLSLLWWLGKTLSVTDRRVIWRSGLFGMRERSLPLRQIQDVTVIQDPFGRLFRYGNVCIESAGGPHTEIVANGISYPREIRDAILDQLA
jgi:uncharacterized membrane protein YdbT with pleckstrin-like domain